MIQRGWRWRWRHGAMTTRKIRLLAWEVRVDYRLLRVGQHKLVALCLADPVWFWTHFVDRRKMPCLAGCGWCPGEERREYGYVAVLVDRPREVAVLELTARTRGRVEGIRKKHGGLRGILLELWRRGDGRSAVEVAARPTVWPAERIPLSCDVEEFLFEQVWRMPRPLGKKMTDARRAKQDRREAAG